MSLRRLVLPALLWAAAACQPRIPVPYPPAVESDFRPRCAAEYGSLGATPSPEVSAARCDCVLRLCEAEWGFGKFTKIIRNIDTGRYRYRYVASPWGYAPVEIPTTFPTEMLDMMERCRLTIADEPL
jgi:hypothetical protein